MAVDIKYRRGYTIDFTNHGDQEIILGSLYNKLVKYEEKQIRYAVKLDEGWDEENSDGPVNALAQLLAASPESDPLVRLLQQEDKVDFSEIVQCSYSEASAYILLLIRFDWSVTDLAAHLFVVITTLRRRLKVSGRRAKIQPSLFDRVEFIDPDFIPQQARQYSEKMKLERLSGQSSWAF